MQVLESKMLGIMFGNKRDEVIWDWKTLHNERYVIYSGHVVLLGW
jgi:hypothetical protein